MVLIVVDQWISFKHSIRQRGQTSNYIDKLRMHVLVYVCVCDWVCMCGCVCVYEWVLSRVL